MTSKEGPGHGRGQCVCVCFTRSSQTAHVSNIFFFPCYLTVTPSSRLIFPCPRLCHSLSLFRCETTKLAQGLYFSFFTLQSSTSFPFTFLPFSSTSHSCFYTCSLSFPVLLLLNHLDGSEVIMVDWTGPSGLLHSVTHM